MLETMDNLLLIENNEPFKLNFMTRIGFLKEKHKFNKAIKEKPKQSDFKETLIIDEILEAEDNE